MGRGSIDDILQVIRTSVQDAVGDRNFKSLSDESILKLHVSIRREVEADNALGGRYRLVGEAAKERAWQLQDELCRRGMSFTPIKWP